MRPGVIVLSDNAFVLQAQRSLIAFGVHAVLVIERFSGRPVGRLLGRVTLFHADDLNTTPSSAARAALESFVFAPHSMLPGRGVAWRAETEDVIVARFDLPPEHPEVRARIDEHGAIRTVSAMRWGMPESGRSSTSRSVAWSTPSGASTTC